MYQSHSSSVHNVLFLSRASASVPTKHFVCAHKYDRNNSCKVLKMVYNFSDKTGKNNSYVFWLGNWCKVHLSFIETTNETIRVNAVAVPSEARERTGETRERHRYILFPCDGVANPIKDVPTGGRPIRLSLARGRRTGQPCAIPCRFVLFP